MTPEQESHLNLLAIFHYIMGGILILTACIPIIHIVMGIVMMNVPASGGMNQQEAQVMSFMGTMFASIGGVIVLLGWLFGVLVILSGRKIHKREGQMYSLVIAGLLCLNVPLGTVLGIFTIIYLCKPEVKEAYGIFPEPEEKW